jgi:hypothetical protein
MVKTVYTNFKANQSSGATITAKINGTAASYSVSVKDATITKGGTDGKLYDYVNNVSPSSTSCTSVKDISIVSGSTSTSYGTSWTNTNNAIKALDKGTYTLKVTYTCGTKTPTGSGTITIN